MEHTKNDRPEFSRVVNLENLGKDEIRLDYLATAEECAALARRFGLTAITCLRALGGLRRMGGGQVRLRVTLEAEVSQTCVVTLDPVVNRIEEDLDILFETERRESAALDSAFDPTADREPLMGDSLDVGEIVAEELAVSLDPYPRKSGISLGIGPSGPVARAEEKPQGGPFEALAALKQKE